MALVTVRMSSAAATRITMRRRVTFAGQLASLGPGAENSIESGHTKVIDGFSSRWGGGAVHGDEPPEPGRGRHVGGRGGGEGGRLCRRVQEGKEVALAKQSLND